MADIDQQIPWMLPRSTGYPLRVGLLSLFWYVYLGARTPLNYTEFILKSYRLVFKLPVFHCWLCNVSASGRQNQDITLNSSKPRRIVPTDPHEYECLRLHLRPVERLPRAIRKGVFCGERHGIEVIILVTQPDQDIHTSASISSIRSNRITLPHSRPALGYSSSDHLVFLLCTVSDRQRRV